MQESLLAQAGLPRTGTASSPWADTDRRAPESWLSEIRAAKSQLGICSLPCLQVGGDSSLFSNILILPASSLNARLQRCVAKLDTKMSSWTQKSFFSVTSKNLQWRTEKHIDYIYLFVTFIDNVTISFKKYPSTAICVGFIMSI